MREEVKVAARRYYETLAKVAAEPRDAATLDVLLHAQCDCRDVIDLLHRLDAERHRLLFSVTLGEPQVGTASATKATVFLHVEQSAGREVDVAGKTIRALPATTGQYALDLVRGDSTWLIRRITRTSS